MTISEGLLWMKTLTERQAELTNLRNENAVSRTVFRGLKGDSADKVEPLYDVVELDRLVSRLAQERRKLDSAIKATNASTHILNYDADESALGELKAK
jgi:DNA-binding Xre family transcriptional regulator